MSSKRKHLYRGDSRAVREEFRERYGARGDEVYGRTIGKAARERAANNGGEYREYVAEHRAENPGGEGSHDVRSHYAEVRADGRRGHSHAHSRGHHGGACGPDCRRGSTGHRHRRR